GRRSGRAAGVVAEGRAGRTPWSQTALAPTRGWPGWTACATLSRMPSRALALGAALVALLTIGGSSALAADFPAQDSRYHSYAEMVDVLMDTQAAHPDIVQVDTIGKSSQGRDLYVVKISDNVGSDENEPEVLFDSLHHAREHLSLEQSLAILRWLADGYG